MVVSLSLEQGERFVQWPGWQSTGPRWDRSPLKGAVAFASISPAQRPRGSTIRWGLGELLCPALENPRRHLRTRMIRGILGTLRRRNDDRVHESFRRSHRHLVRAGFPCPSVDRP